MANSPKIVDLSARLTGSGGLGATISARYAGTDRLVCADSTYGEVDAWANGGSTSLLRRHVMYSKIELAISSAPVVAEESLSYFRGRSAPFAGTTPKPDEMGPPPLELALAGRYNSAGQSVLYLCSDKLGVRRELSSVEGQVWVQNFKIPLTNLRIADLRPRCADTGQLLACTMWFAELSGADGYPAQIFSREIAAMIERHFDGMLVAGVRGDSSLQYSNLVVLNPCDRWRQWLSQGIPMLL